MLPLADRVFVIPDPVATETASGLHIIDHWPAETSGTVAAVGRRVHPLGPVVAEAIEALNSVKCTRAGKPLVERLAAVAWQLVSESSVRVGQRVIFSRTTGQELDLDGTRYLVLRESDILGVVESSL